MSTKYALWLLVGAPLIYLLQRPTILSRMTIGLGEPQDIAVWEGCSHCIQQLIKTAGKFIQQTFPGESHSASVFVYSAHKNIHFSLNCWCVFVFTQGSWPRSSFPAASRNGSSVGIVQACLKFLLHLTNSTSLYTSLYWNTSTPFSSRLLPCEKNAYLSTPSTSLVPPQPKRYRVMVVWWYMHVCVGYRGKPCTRFVGAKTTLKFLLVPDIQSM